MSEEQAKALLEAQKHPLFDQAFKMIVAGRSPFHIRSLLEEAFCPSTCLAILDCLSCRHRYRDKFEQASQWLLTRNAAEQASDSRVARWRAQFLSSRYCGESLQELGCGIGGDSVYLSREFELCAYEQDPARALLAKNNVERLGRLGRGKICTKKVDPRELRGDLLFVDPARRDGERITSPERWLPPLSEVAACCEHSRFPKVAIKCAPGLKSREMDGLPGTVETFYISLDGELKEAFVLLSAKGARKSKHAVMLSSTAEPVTLTGLDLPIPLAGPREGLFLHNPNPAILRARALDTLAQNLEASLIHPKIGYLVGPRVAQEPFAQSFQILEHFPLHWSTLKKKLSRSDWSDYEYLGRGVPFSQTDVRQKLPKLKRKKSSPSPIRGSVIIYREEQGYTVVLALRISSSKGKSSPRESKANEY